MAASAGEATERSPLLPLARSADRGAVTAPAPAPGMLVPPPVAHLSADEPAKATRAPPSSHAPPPPCTPPPSSTRSQLVGYLFIFLGSTVFALNSFFVHIAETQHGLLGSHIVLTQAALGLLFSLSYLALAPRRAHVLVGLADRHTVVVLAVRGMMGISNMLLLSAALALVSSGDAVAVYFVSPIFAMLFAAAVLRERVRAADLAAVAVAVLGVALITRGGGGGGGVVAADEGNGPALRAQLLGSLCALAAAAANAASMTAVRVVAATVHPLATALAVQLAAVVLLPLLRAGGGAGAAAAALLGAESRALVLVALGAMCVFAAQLCLILALQRAPVGPTSLIASTKVPILYALGIVFLHESVSPRRAVGAALVLSASVAVGVSRAVGANSRLPGLSSR